MAYGLDSEKFLIAEPKLWKGVYTVMDMNDPVSKFAGEYLTYTKQGTVSIDLARTYAEALVGTPSTKVRKDLVSKQFNVMFQAFQFNSEVMEILIGSDLNNMGTRKIHYIGHDEPVQSTYGWLLTGKLTDGSDIKIGIFKGKITTEDVVIAPSGTEHAVINGKIEAFQDTRTNSDSRDYGFIEITPVVA